MATALASVSDKTGLSQFLKRLESFGALQLIGTTSTASYLNSQGMSCRKVEDITQFPEILSGRVKTLHPRVFAGILSRPSKEDRSCLAELAIDEIDLVIANLYPFEDKLRQGLPEPDMIEHIDIGGVTLLRAAAKNFERVTVICDPAQYDRVIEDMKANNGQITLGMRKRLAFEALSRTASYDRTISAYLAGRLDEAPATGGLPTTVCIELHKHQDLRYGENPHQEAAWYFASNSAGPPFDQLQGKELSHNNLTDIYALVQVLREIGSPSCCIIKHNNPCGVAIGDSVHDAFEKAYACDPVSAFGGIYGFSDTVDGALAERVITGFVEIVLAPTFDPSALAVLSKKKNVRVLRLHPTLLDKPAMPTPHAEDMEEFGWLLDRDREPLIAASKFTCVTRRQVEPGSEADIAFAWGVVKRLTSNAIFVARDGQSLGFGIGQTSRIGSMNLALAQAGERSRGAVLASDAFFPATDNIEAAAKAGIEIIIQPGGSIKDKEVIAACDQSGISMLFTGQRCFRH